MKFLLPRSTIGKKAVVGVTGLVLFGFVVGHMLGNLQIFLGPQKLNDYSEFLHGATELLWGTRLTLLAAIFLHIAATADLARLNRASRPVAYQERDFRTAGPTSRFMIWSGAFLGLYILYHLMDLTSGAIHPNFEPHNVYANVIRDFSVWYVSLFYLIAMICLGFHLHHGVASVFQTLGLNHPKYNGWRRCLATGAAILIPLGYSSIPLAVLAGVLHL